MDPSTAPYEIDDLDLIALVDPRGGKRRTLQDRQIVFHGHAPCIYFQTGEQLGDSHGAGHLVRFSVEGDFQRYLTSRKPRTKSPTGNSAWSFTGNRRASVEIQTAMLLPTG